MSTSAVSDGLMRALSALTQTPSANIAGNGRLPQCEVDWLTKRLMLPPVQSANGPSGTCPP